MDIKDRPFDHKIRTTDKEWHAWAVAAKDKSRNQWIRDTLNAEAERS